MRARPMELDGSTETWAETRSGLVVPTYAAPPALPKAVDLFAGAGGFSLGMHQGGFHVAGALEWWAIAACTYLVNLGGPDTTIYVGRTPSPEASKREKQIHQRWGGQEVRAGDVFEEAGGGWIASECGHEPGTCAPHIDEPEGKRWFCETYHADPIHREPCEYFWMCDAREITGADILAALGVDELDCIFGGPPCQGFSMAGKRNVMDPRNSLVFEFARLVLEARPRSMVMENVPGILSMVTPDGRNVVDALTEMLERGDYGDQDTLRRSLLATAGLKPGAAHRNRHKPVEETEVDDGQEALFV